MSRGLYPASQATEDLTCVPSFPSTPLMLPVPGTCFLFFSYYPQETSLLCYFKVSSNRALTSITHPHLASQTLHHVPLKPVSSLFHSLLISPALTLSWLSNKIIFYIPLIETASLIAKISSLSSHPMLSPRPGTASD